MGNWVPFVVLTVLAWGAYIPTLHKGQAALGGSGLHAFLMVGVAYLLVAILIPGALGALGIVFALINGGRPTVVPPLVFAGAPVVSVFVGMLYNPPQNSPSPVFFVGLIMAAVGASLVMSFRPT